MIHKMLMSITWFSKLVCLSLLVTCNNSILKLYTLHLGRLPNSRGWKRLIVINALAYFTRVQMTMVKCFMVTALDTKMKLLFISNENWIFFFFAKKKIEKCFAVIDIGDSFLTAKMLVVFKGVLRQIHIFLFMFGQPSFPKMIRPMD
jgi:hypothetical protein